MATIRKRRGKWQAQVRRKGVPAESATFETKSAAERWARKIERAIDDGTTGGRAQPGTVADMLDRYEVEVRGFRPLGRSKLSSLGLVRKGLGHVELKDLDAGRIIKFARERQAAGAGPVTLNVDLAYLGTVLRTARALWRWQVSDEPVREARDALRMVGMVGRSRSRDRRPAPAETDALCAYWRANPRQSIPMADIWEFAIASAMRLGEIVRIRWADLDEAASTVTIRDRKDPRQKAGNDEKVPLLFGALDIILRQPRTTERIFPYNERSVSTAFQRACAELGIEGLTFHDGRHEGVSRLFERGFRIEQVALVSGHKDWRTLRRYTQLRAEDLVTLSLARSQQATSGTPRGDKEPPSPSS